VATFTNRATLSYVGGTVDSNTVTGELLEVLLVTKTAVRDVYAAGDRITYVVALRNTGTTALEELTLTDSLGGYVFGEETLYPLAYVDGSVLYYRNGVLQPTLAVTAGPPMVISGINVPAGGDAVIVYETELTEFAPLGEAGEITNTVTVSGGGLSAPITASETVTADPQVALSITKALSPAVVPDNGELTYTFTVQNSGNIAAGAEAGIVITDIFDPRLSGITATLNGEVLTEGVDYTYDPASGTFVTVAGVVTVPAAEVTQNPDGSYTVTPGVSTLTVTGTV